MKHYFKYDVALDAFGAHAMGGIIGRLFTGFFAQAGRLLSVEFLHG